MAGTRTECEFKPQAHSWLSAHLSKANRAALIPPAPPTHPARAIYTLYNVTWITAWHPVCLEQGPMNQNSFALIQFSPVPRFETGYSKVTRHLLGLDCVGLCGLK